MKFFKWKIFMITGIVCLLPILFGILIWNSLPDVMAIHFNFHGAADGFAKKGFVVFGIPVMMVFFQAICCFASDLSAKKDRNFNKLEETVSKWIIPCITVVLYVITLGYGMGWNVDMRKACAIIVGVLFIVIGSCLSKFNRLKNIKVDAEKARKINRFVGCLTVIWGILFLISAFLPPIFMVVCFLLLIPYTVTTIVYTKLNIRK